MQRWWQEGELGNESKSTLWMDKGVNEGFSHWDLELRCLGELLFPAKHLLELLQDMDSGSLGHPSWKKKPFSWKWISFNKLLCVGPSRILRKDREHKPFPAPR